MGSVIKNYLEQFYIFPKQKILHIQKVRETKKSREMSHTIDWYSVGMLTILIELINSLLDFMFCAIMN
jgi:hypothetical protein